LKVLNRDNSAGWDEAIKELPSGSILGERQIIFQRIEELEKD